MEIGLILLLSLPPIFGAVGWWIGDNKGRGAAGFWWGFFLNVIGLLVIASLSPADARKRKPCPSCAELILANATKCRFCGETVNNRSD